MHIDSFPRCDENFFYTPSMLASLYYSCSDIVSLNYSPLLQSRNNVIASHPDGPGAIPDLVKSLIEVFSFVLLQIEEVCC